MIAKKEGVFGDQARSVALLWGERATARRGPRPALSLDRIVEGAIALADREGLEAVSMERVACAFGFSAMSLYRYVPGKPELVDLMIEAAIGAPPARGTIPEGWRDRLTEWARRLTGAFRRHPWALAATGRLRVMGPHELGWLEAGLAALEDTALSAPERHAACLAVLAQVRSTAQFSVALPRGRSGLTGAGWRAATRAVLRARAGGYPGLRATLAAPPLDPAGPEDVGFGVRCVLDGIGVLVERRRLTAKQGGDRAGAGRRTRRRR